MDTVEMRGRFAAARVAHLATVRADGRPHVVPICFAVDGDRVVSLVDDKPKRSLELTRLANVRLQPAVSVLVDEYYDDDWSRLWWVRADGSAAVVEGGVDHSHAAGLLAAKYPQYAHHRDVRPAGAVLVITVERWSGWASVGSSG
jgi:PPOX class probable F420-dependent enzyme